jgi:hypothetical protein
MLCWFMLFYFFSKPFRIMDGLLFHMLILLIAYLCILVAGRYFLQVLTSHRTLKSNFKIIGIWSNIKIKPKPFNLPFKITLFNYKHHYVWRFNGVFCSFYFAAAFKFKPTTKRTPPTVSPLSNVYSRILKRSWQTYQTPFLVTDNNTKSIHFVRLIAIFDRKDSSGKTTYSCQYRLVSLYIGLYISWQYTDGKTYWI